jgi:predicted O-methyltransferase YrrM
MDALQRRAIDFATRNTDRFADLVPQSPAENAAAVSLVRSRFYAAFAAATRTTYVLTVGDRLVHAAFHIADGFGHTGHLDMVVSDPPLAKSVTTAISRHSLEERIRLHNANPTSVVPNLNGPFDLLIVDARPVEAAVLYEHLVRLLRVGGSMALELPADGGQWLERLATDERLYVHVPDTESPTIAVRTR